MKLITSFVLFLVLLLISPKNGDCQYGFKSGSGQNNPDKVYLHAGISTGFSLASVYLSPVIPRAQRTPYYWGISILTHSGHLLNSQNRKAISYIGASTLLSGLSQLSNMYHWDSGKKKPIGGLLAKGMVSTNWYSAYEVYRDANRKYRAEYSGIDNRNLLDYSLAPFSQENLSNPWVSVPVIGIGVGYPIYLLLSSDSKSIFSIDRVNLLGRDVHPFVGAMAHVAYHFIIAEMAAVSEEALMRGVIQNELSQHMNRWTSIALTSLIFSSLHLPAGLSDKKKTNFGNVSTLLLMGAIATSPLSIAYAYNDNDLAIPIAAHFWGDFLLPLLPYLFDPESHNRFLPKETKTSSGVHFVPLSWNRGRLQLFAIEVDF